MGKLEEYRKEEFFSRFEHHLKNLAYFAKNDQIYKGVTPHKKLYRIFPFPIDELDRWEETGGYDPALSSWHRFPCTSNRYLGCMIKKGLKPPGLYKTQVMIEISDMMPDCVEYSNVAIQNFPTIGGRRARDIYVDQEDLPLFECWLEHKVDIKDIEKMYIAENADEDVKIRTEEFAKKHDIPLEYKIPCPSDDDPFMHKGDRPRDWGVTDESIEELAAFFRQRHKECLANIGQTPADTIVAAMAEAFDEAYHELTPLGSSDAIYTRNERIREKKPYLATKPGPECDSIICKSIEELTKSLKP